MKITWVVLSLALMSIPSFGEKQPEIHFIDDEEMEQCTIEVEMHKPIVRGYVKGDRWKATYHSRFFGLPYWEVYVFPKGGSDWISQSDYLNYLKTQGTSHKTEGQE